MMVQCDVIDSTDKYDTVPLVVGTLTLLFTSPLPRTQYESDVKDK